MSRVILTFNHYLLTHEGRFTLHSSRFTLNTKQLKKTEHQHGHIFK